MNPAKPTALKVLEGNPGCRPLNLNEPKPSTEIPKCPEWLMDEAKAEWSRIVPELSRLKLLTAIDGAALIAYCQSWARYVEAEQYLSINDTVFVSGNDYMQQVPQVSIAQKYLNICKAFMIQFGMTPSSRGNMSIAPDKLEDDPMTILWKQRKA